MAIEHSKILVIRHEQCSSLGLLGAVPRQAGVSLNYLDTPQGETLTDPIASYSHIIVLGGAVSAFEDDQYAYLRYEFNLLEQALDLKIPTLGICLGSQILAKVLGSRVYRGELGREAGWCNLELTDAASNDLLFQNFPKQFKTFESHQDTFDIPTGCVHLARSDMYPNQAFCYQDYVWALQFHIEIDENVLGDCSAIIEKELKESGIQDTTLVQLLEEAKAESPAVVPLANDLMQRFLQMKGGKVVVSQSV